MKPSTKPSNRCAHCDAINASYVVYCRSCGQKIKVDRKAWIIRYHVSFYLNDERFKLDQTTTVYSTAQGIAVAWIDHGPAARSREARIHRTINDQNDPTFSEVRRYDNYKQRRKVTTKDGHCETCKGRGRVKVVPASVRVTCRHCEGTGSVTTSVSGAVTAQGQVQAERPQGFIGPLMLATVTTVVGHNMDRPPVIQDCEKCKGTGYRASTAGIKVKSVDVKCPECHGLQRNYSNIKLQGLYNHLALHPTDTRAASAVHREKERVGA